MPTNELDNDQLARRFEENRGHLRAVAYRMLGSVSEADDAVQEAWLRLSRVKSEEIENLGGWLTTVVGRICLDMLRARKARGEDLFGPHVPDPIVSREDSIDPEQEALLTDSVGLALMVVLETLSPAERLAYVLHDMFSVPFEEIASLVDRGSAATRKLASRARGRVRDSALEPDVDLERQREVVDAFFAAAREGDFEALVSVLDPDVVLHSDGGRLRADANAVARGATEVASRASKVRRPLPVGPPGAGQRRGRRRRVPSGQAVLGDCLHRPWRQDRRDRRPRGPRAPGHARPRGARELKLRFTAPPE